MSGYHSCPPPLTPPPPPPPRPFLPSQSLSKSLSISTISLHLIAAMGISDYKNMVANILTTTSTLHPFFNKPATWSQLMLARSQSLGHCWERVVLQHEKQDERRKDYNLQWQKQQCPNVEELEVVGKLTQVATDKRWLKEKLPPAKSDNY